MISKSPRRSYIILVPAFLLITYTIYTAAQRHGSPVTSHALRSLKDVRSRIPYLSNEGNEQVLLESDEGNTASKGTTLEDILQTNDEVDDDGEAESKEQRLEQWAADTFAKSSDIDFDDLDGDYTPLTEGKDYREIFSRTSRDRGFIGIYTGGVGIYNPNIVPHPTRYDLWIVVGQRHGTGHVSEQMVCTAGFFAGALLCSAEPTLLPVEGSISGQCEGDLAFHNMRPGPRDFRMFHGPSEVYMTYGSQSTYTCLGVWLQDARVVLDEYVLEKDILTTIFKSPTEVKRPTPAQAIEKDYFIFWDASGKTYVHHDLFPRRVFAVLDFDGSVGEDLAPAVETQDAICMAKYMPTLGPDDESIHQATNSLTITMCNRGECTPDANNTFIMTIFHHKSHLDYHSIYEPYVMLFAQSAPFGIQAISQRPLWIHGRAPLTKGSDAKKEDPSLDAPKIFYITSMSWKSHGQRYQGYLDDPVILAFGIEESKAAIMDVTAGDLVEDLGYCN